jgi:hypothetical protein
MRPGKVITNTFKASFHPGVAVPRVNSIGRRTPIEVELAYESPSIPA